MKERDNNEYVWIFFAAHAKPSSMRKAIPERLAETEPVVIVEQPVSLLRDRTFRPLSRRCRPFNKDGNSWYYRPMHFPEKLPGIGGFFRILNEKLIKKEIEQLLGSGGDRVVCYDSPAQHPLVKGFREKLSIYLAVDDRTLTVWGEPIPGEIEAEKKLMAKVDNVICVSEILVETLKCRMPKGATPSIIILPNAYDERIFDPCKIYQEPAPLKDVPKPRILITGHISERIDWDGIAAASKLRPNWTWVFLGPADPGMMEKLQRLFDTQAIWHPPIPVEEVPAWISHCDACAVPYRLNSFTRASHPLKAIEYLAMGSPVLSTKIPCLKSYDSAIQWVKEGDGDSYVLALDNVWQSRSQSGLPRSSPHGIEGQSWGVKSRIFRGLITNAMSIKQEISKKK